MFQEGRTALLVACWRGFLPIVTMLIKSGANTNAQDQVCYCIDDHVSFPGSGDLMSYNLVSVNVCMHDVCVHRRVLVV